MGYYRYEGDACVFEDVVHQTILTFLFSHLLLVVFCLMGCSRMHKILTALHGHERTLADLKILLNSSHYGMINSIWQDTALP